MTEIEIIAHLSRALAELPLLRENVRILEEANLQLQRELGYVQGELSRAKGPPAPQEPPATEAAGR